MDGNRFRFIGLNKYPLLVQTMAQADVQAFFDGCKNRSVSVVRTWCFDAGNPPSDSAGNFRYLDYPLGTNLITNPSVETNLAGFTAQDGTALNSSVFTRSNETAEDGSWSVKQVSSWGTYDALTYAVTVTASTNYVWTFWHKIQAIAGDGSHFPPVFGVGDATNASWNGVKDGGISSDDGGVWHRTQLLFNSGSNTQVHLNIMNFGGENLCYFDNFNLCVQGTPTLATREASFVQLDMVLDEARQRGIKLILSLADNPTYGTKQTYCHWADAIYGTSLEAAGYPYVGFFDNVNCRTLYKNFFALLANRVNTINGRVYKNDDTIFSWELGNELRYDVFTSEGGTQNTAASTDIAAVKDWILDAGASIKSVDPNHLLGYGDMGHTWQWVNGDVVSNGSGYGVDYNIFSAISYLDYLDFHLYPTQGDNVHLQEYGQRLGYPNAVTGDGFRAQLRDYVASAKSNGKPALCGELGMIRENIADTTYFPLYPRSEAFRNIYVTFFDEADGDGMVLWHGEITDGGTYTINLTGWDGTTTNLNYNDIPLVNHINERNGMLNGKRIRVIDTRLSAP